MKYLVANWKMNPITKKEAHKLAASIKRQKGVEVVLCPPFPFLQATSHKLQAGIKLGAQNCHFADFGAYTGEVSANMLKDLGVKYAIIGHSERRGYFNEDNNLINKKLKAAFKNKIIPILAVGEREQERQDAAKVVATQLKEGLKNISKNNISNILIAYEPVWAIGTGKAASPDDALTMKLHIQKVLSAIYNKSIAQKIPVLYGGSTNAKNIEVFLKEGQMDGALVGGASLKEKEFNKMIALCNL